jgi:rfaE bifunctional protein kinase chain/domain/rfaE bifunctional protein nucleotidyltransferase chain/domain
MQNKKVFNNFSSFNKKLKNIKINKKKIILCHGVFDLLHAGHLYSFNQAKENGDLLIVSITSDQFVKKAPGRPFFKFDERANVIAGLSIVDYIIKSDYETSVNVINFLKPDIYFKGPDYKNNKSDITNNIYKEIKAVKKNKGKVVYGTTKTFSSSKILNSLENFSKSQKKVINLLKKKYGFLYIEKNILNKIKNDNILILGESIFDKYIFTKYLGVSGKEAIKTLERINEKKYAGGSLAVANNVSSFVKKIDLVTVLGDNSNDVAFCKKKLMKNIKLNFLIRKESPSINKTKILDIDSNEKVIGLYEFNEKELSEAESKKFQKIFNKKLTIADTVIVSDYGHNMINQNLSKKISNIRKKNLIVNTQINAANFGYHTISKYRGVQSAVINEIELRFEMRDRKKSVEELLVNLSKNLKIKNLFVTCGKKGSYAYSSSQQKIFHCPAYATNIVDKIGAGDSYMSTLGVILKYCKKDLLLAMFIASVATIDIISSYGNETSINVNSLKKRLLYIFK